MTVYYTQRDAPAEIRNHLRTLTFHPPDVQVRSELPDTWTINDPPVVTVQSDGTPHHQHATSTENVRVTVYGKYEPTVRTLATHIDAVLLNPRNHLGFLIQPGPGLISTRDDETGGWIAAITVTASSPKKGVRFS